MQRAIDCRTASASFGLLFCVVRLFLDVVNRSGEERRTRCQKERNGFSEAPTDV